MNRANERALGYVKNVNPTRIYLTPIYPPAFIVHVRKKLAVGQREAAEIFGGGINAFSRYENGKTKPPLALIKLFKLPDRHPELLSEVKTA